MRIPAALIGFGAAALLAACGSGAGASEPSEEKAADAASARTLPTFRQPPDKPAGPKPPAVAGTAASFRVERFARGLDMPNQIVARPGDDRLYVSEQGGRVRVVGPDGTVRRAPFLDIRDRTDAEGERGLLSLTFTPDGKGLVVLYTNNKGDSRVVRFPAGRDRARRGAGRTLLAVRQPYANHNGGTVLYDERGRLIVGLGDGGSAFDPQQRAQDLGTRLGKILRYERGRWKIVAFGLRNPWRMSFDRETGRLWIGDVGQDEIEEVDAVWLPEEGQPLLNLGWAAYEGHKPVGVKRLSSKGKLVWPVASYGHEQGRCSITGGEVYRGSAVPALRGRYVYGDFCRGTLWSLRADGADDPRRLDIRRERARVPGLVSFGSDRRGELYAVSLSGGVYRLAAAR